MENLKFIKTLRNLMNVIIQIQWDLKFFKFCLENKIKLIYSATSASLGNNGKINLSPYAFTKSKNLELLENLKKWFKFKFEVVYF